MPQLLLNVIYTAKRGMREKFVETVTSGGLLQRIRAENGCLGYDYYYAAENADQVLLVERWESETAQQAHMEHANMAELKALKEKFLAGTQLTKARF